MIEFKQASTGSDTYVANVNDLTVYLFKMPGRENYHLTCNQLGIVGAAIVAIDFKHTIIVALRNLAMVARTRASDLVMHANAFDAEAEVRMQPDVQIPASEPKP